MPVSPSPDFSEGYPLEALIPYPDKAGEKEIDNFLTLILPKNQYLCPEFNLYKPLNWDIRSLGLRSFSVDFLYEERARLNLCQPDGGIAAGSNHQVFTLLVREPA